MVKPHWIEVVEDELDVRSRPRVWILGVLGAVLAAEPLWHAVLLFVALESRSPILDRHLKEWHLRCDTHLGKSVETPEGLDCSRELHELIVYAEMKGRTSRVEELTALAKKTGWSRE